MHAPPASPNTDTNDHQILHLWQPHTPTAEWANYSIKSNDKEIRATFHVVSKEADNLLGSHSAEELGLLLFMKIVRTFQVDELLGQFPELFPSLGCLKAPPIQLHIDKVVKPVAQTHPVPSPTIGGAGDGQPRKPRASSWQFRLQHRRNRERSPDFLTRATSAKASAVLVGGFPSHYEVAKTTRTLTRGTRISGFPR
ncbi:hypothetical protein NDU88_003148 [Pleurodeles waltl]|uniref:Uncharacterized protein n=1 Tax=Pleurodeles waltl TaxID=8319 RepID=A0AAV7W568_PLEWA|nr:hypothetical protein NDU88_003148 [Pleurodeles waltl]